MLSCHAPQRKQGRRNAFFKGMREMGNRKKKTEGGWKVVKEVGKEKKEKRKREK